MRNQGWKLIRIRLWGVRNSAFRVIWPIVIVWTMEKLWWVWELESNKYLVFLFQFTGQREWTQSWGRENSLGSFSDGRQTNFFFKEPFSKLEQEAIEHIPAIVNVAKNSAEKWAGLPGAPKKGYGQDWELRKHHWVPRNTWERGKSISGKSLIIWLRLWEIAADDLAEHLPGKSMNLSLKTLEGSWEHVDMGCGNLRS